jgi:hypothetical protein
MFHIFIVEREGRKLLENKSIERMVGDAYFDKEKDKLWCQ